MKSVTSFLESVLAARMLPGAEDRRGVARVALTVFGRTLGDGPSGLATADFEALVTAAAVLVSEKLAGDVGGPAPHVGPAAGAALYEITAALPRSPLRSELGRSVATHLYQGAAPTFAAIARRMAQSGARALSGPGIEARIELSMFLPLDVDDGVDAFALAIATQRELAAQWVVTASTRSLPERRLASRLILRAAREATRRARAGDGDALASLLEEPPPPPPKRSTPPPPSTRAPSGSIPPPRTTRGSTIPPAQSGLVSTWDELVAEREAAVWKYAAAARGLLAGVVDDARESIHASLAPEAGATAWRRAACALGASLATSEGDDAFLRAVELARSPLVQRDPGVLTALVWGLSVAADVEPQACDELLAELAKTAPITIAEPLVELRREVRGAGDRARVPCRNALTASLEQGDTDRGLVALARDVRDDLDGTAERRLTQTIDSALMVFADVGAGAAHARATVALAAADDLVKRLEQQGDATPDARATQGTSLVREADSALLESRLLPALFALGVRGQAPAERAPEAAAVAALDERLAVLLLAREARETEDAATNVTYHQRNLRALLHLVDAAATEEADGERREQLRLRCERVVVATAGRLATSPTSQLTRAVAATLARALDALVRHGFADAADVWLFAGARDLTDNVVGILAEASRNPDVIAVLEPAARFAAQVREARADRASAPEALATESRIGALSRLSTGMHAGVSPGGDHLRRSLARLARDLESLLAEPAADRADSVTRELDALRPLVTAAIQRCAGRSGDRRRTVAAPPAAALTSISFGGLADWVKGAESELPRDLARLAEETFRLTAVRVPDASGTEQAVVATEAGVTFVAAGAAAKGGTRPDGVPPQQAAVEASEAMADLPAWIPRRRTLGGFYVHERLGSGASGSVFVVSRFDEHDDPDAERYALKVPEWDATTSRTLSETEFMRLFRSEASALMELPEHPNLARFVTFDAGARPKPILVMELVVGDSGEQLLAERRMDVARAFDIVDGVLAGLVAMHAAGVGHLDLKPSNVILRRSEAGGGDVPVLVDFGLAGKHMRPGCGTVAYGAPEVWLELEGVSPTRTDIYAFACFAFEMLTGKPLFAAPSDHAIVAAHLTHDGGPPALETLADGPTQKLVTLLAECLRRDPTKRPTALDLRKRVGALRSSIVGARWPIGS
jgi:hypothetical protein